MLTLEDMGIPVEYSQHEDAPSQHEIDLRYTDALTMADTVMTVRMVVKEIAAQHGVMATFMPKPLFGVQGSGMHTHCRCSTATPTPSTTTADEYQPVRRWPASFIAGVLRHAREITAVTNQWVNSYKRLIVGYEAPVYISWARNNRSALVRVPPTKKGKRDSTRIEYRAPDSAANPYLAFAAVLAAGLAGIERGYELPPEAAANLYELSAEQRLAEGIDALPGSLAEAVDVMERSELMAEMLGEHVFEWFVRNKRAEWADYKAEVTAVRAAPLPHLAVRPEGGVRVEPLLAFPDPAPPALAQALDLAGYPWKAAGSADAAERLEPEDGWAGAIVCADDDPEGAFALCRALRKRDLPFEPLLLLVAGTQLGELELREDLFDDFCVTPFQPKELEARLAHLFWRTGRGTRPELVEYGPLDPQPGDLPGRRSPAGPST